MQGNMQGNSNKLIDTSRLCENQRVQNTEAFNCAQSPPVTAQPQLFFKNYNKIVNSDRTNSRSNIIGGKPLIKYTTAYGRNIRPWLKMSHHSDPNTRLNASSVVINFDNINEPTTSHSVDVDAPCMNKSFPEKFHQSVPLLESTRSNDHQNLSDCTRDTSIDILNSNRIYTGNSDNNNNSSNSNNSDNNTSASNNNNNNNHHHHHDTSVIQSSGGTHAENSTSGNQSMEKIFNKYIPFITFLLLKAIYDHREGILIFVALLVTFIHANHVVKREIAKHSRRSLFSLGIIFINLFVSICFIYFVFKDQHLYKNLIFIPPYSQPLNIWDVLWIVGITDFVLKFITIQLKVGMTCFPAKLLPYSARGKWYLLLERTSQLYRGLVPIQPWLYYLMEVYQGPDNTVGMCFSVVYVISKGSDIKSKVKLFFKAFWKLLHNASLGVRPSNEQLVSAGSQCPICHDEYNSPIILQCRHVFCESCVSTWFDREQTCPLCRAKIADDPSWRDGATSLFTQLF